MGWGFILTKRAGIDWHCWHSILSSGVTPPGKRNKGSPLFPALVCSAQVFFCHLWWHRAQAPSSTVTDEPLLILFLSLCPPVPLIVPTCDPRPLSDQDSPSLAAGCPLCLSQVTSGGIWPPKCARIKMKYQMK